MESLIEEFVKIRSGYGDGYGYGDGSGYGYGDGSGIISVNNKKVYKIDGLQTIITSVRDNVAKGYILQSDLTLTPCFIVKEDDKFAHGSTLHEAFASLQEKLYNDSSEEERISKFKEHFIDFDKAYPVTELFIMFLQAAARQDGNHSQRIMKSTLRTML